VNIKENRTKLFELYAQFEDATRPHLADAVCKPGCADCCTTVGDVDATTLEGMVILGHVQTLPSSVQKDFHKKLKQNRKVKSELIYARCAFLLANNTCGIYAARPFSCRRLYSLKPCGETGPTVNRKVWELSEETVAAIHGLDSTGYSGHISFILQLLNDSVFRKTYLTGGFSPDDIRELARKHRIVINRFAGVPG